MGDNWHVNLHGRDNYNSWRPRSNQPAIPPHTHRLMREHAHQLLRRLSLIAGGIMDFISRLKFKDFWWFLGILLLVLFSLVQIGTLNWSLVLLDYLYGVDVLVATGDIFLLDNFS
jgi:hypothetical protein